MTSNQGFGKVKSSKKSGKSSEKRAVASKQYDKMKEEGLPEFNIYMRIKDKKNWFPVGSLAVNRSSHIERAIFENLEALREGGFRLFPMLRKHQQNLEYGFKLKGKEFADEPIQVAVPPKPSAGNFIQNAVAQVKNSVSGLLKRG
ncbi:HHL1-like protein [Microcoleus sp. FACHB-68]|uniref:HHL1-like protein n=1 Tax=Microcoleus sp. FACHB-68 TaxID=2692826 RepID=UPI001687D93D|nr:HHL1-like protein [Microcoleus sp. FACHB-68]MBD1936503.1 hypothetical protein [Microcoleus sp. FACHB-68]